MMYYSFKTCGFYDSTLNSPDDCMPIDDDVYLRLLKDLEGGGSVDIDDDGNWFVRRPEEPIDALRLEVVNQAKAYRDELTQSAGVLVEGNWFPSDRDSRIKYIGIKVGAPAPRGLVWKTMGGELVEMNLGLSEKIIAAIASLDSLAFIACLKHVEAIKSSDAPKDYDLSNGWPDKFVSG